MIFVIAVFQHRVFLLLYQSKKALLHYHSYFYNFLLITALMQKKRA